MTIRFDFFPLIYLSFFFFFFVWVFLANFFFFYHKRSTNAARCVALISPFRMYFFCEEKGLICSPTSVCSGVWGWCLCTASTLPKQKSTECIHPTVHAGGGEPRRPPEFRWVLLVLPQPDPGVWAGMCIYQSILWWVCLCVRACVCVCSPSFPPFLHTPSDHARISADVRSSV